MLALSLSFSLFTFRDNHLSRSTNDIVSVKKTNKQKKLSFPFFSNTQQSSYLLYVRLADDDDSARRPLLFISQR